MGVFERARDFMFGMNVIMGWIIVSEVNRNVFKEGLKKGFQMGRLT